jgi:aspartate aminotransferase-like enzyme
MEAAVVNVLSPGDKLLNANVGVFGERFGIIAERYGAEVTTLNFPFGEAVDIDKLRDALNADPDIKVVSVTHNETSTGVTNPIKQIAAVAKGEFGKLVIVDGISSVCSLPLETDAWGLDVVATASQKGWMMPPGFAFLSFSEDAWKAYENSKMPKFYFDMGMYRRYFETGQPPYTPAVSLMFAMDVALAQILAEGMGSVFERHASIGRFTRAGVRKLGLSLLAREEVASDTVTAVKVPEGVDAGRLVGKMRTEHDVVLAGGQASLSGKIFRIGHMGRTEEKDIQDVIDSLAVVLGELGFKKS